MGWAVMWTTRQGPQIQIECPRCAASPAIADTEETRERLLLLGLIPVLQKTTTYVVCTACGARMQSRIRLDDLPGHTPDQLRPFLSHHVPAVVVVLLIASVMTLCMPPLSFLFALVAVLVTWSAPGWARTLSRTLAVASGAMAAVMLSVFFLLPRGGFHWGARWQRQWPARAAPDRRAGRDAPDGRDRARGLPADLPDLPDLAPGWPPEGRPPFPPRLPAGGDAVTGVLSQLSSGNPAFEPFALHRLARMRVEEDRREEVTEALVPRLSDPSPLTRAAAVEALAAWHTPEAVPKMTESAADPDFSVRWAAFKALANVPEPEVATAVAGQLPSMQDQGPAAHALIQMGSAAEDAVIEYLDHPDGMVRLQACLILEAIGTQKSLEKLIPLSREGDFHVRPRAQQAVEAIRSRTTE